MCVLKLYLWRKVTKVGRLEVHVRRGSGESRVGRARREGKVGRAMVGDVRSGILNDGGQVLWCRCRLQGSAVLRSWGQVLGSRNCTNRNWLHGSKVLRGGVVHGSWCAVLLNGNWNWSGCTVLLGAGRRREAGAASGWAVAGDRSRTRRRGHLNVRVARRWAVRVSGFRTSQGSGQNTRKHYKRFHGIISPDVIELEDEIVLICP